MVCVCVCVNWCQRVTLVSSKTVLPAPGRRPGTAALGRVAAERSSDSLTPKGLLIATFKRLLCVAQRLLYVTQRARQVLARSTLLSPLFWSLSRADNNLNEMFSPRERAETHSLAVKRAAARL